MAYHDGISQSLKPEKTLTPLVHCTPWNGATVKGQYSSTFMGVTSLLREPNQRLW